MARFGVQVASGVAGLGRRASGLLAVSGGLGFGV